MLKHEVLDNRFKINKKIGNGSFSEVYSAFDKLKNRKCALKIFNKENIKKELLFDYFSNDIAYKEIIESIINEAKIMEICKSKNIVEIYEYYETENLIILVLELCNTDLSLYYEKKMAQKEKNDFIFIQKLFNDLNNAIKILHQNNIIHRDIKFSNIFIKFEENGEFVIKLGDFGTAKINEFENKCATKVGTILFMAPEIMNGETYNYKCDLYSLGVCLYFSIFFEFPYEGSHEITLLNQMFNYGQKYFHKSGNESLDNLIKGLLEIDPKKRISMDEYLNHPFFEKNSKKINTLINQKNIETNIVTNKELNDKKEHIKNLNDKIENKQSEYIENMKEIIKYSSKIHDIMEIANAYAKNKESFQEKDIKMVKIANILYYDENIKKHMTNIHQDSDYFERKTPGAFILCTNILSLKFVMEEIKYYNKSKPNTLFNLIVTGSKFQKVMDFLSENKYDIYFENICIYCINVEKYSNLKKQYNKIKEVCKNQSEVIKFIDKVSSNKSKEFKTVKIISYFDYKDKYYERHMDISKFYGKLSKEIYNEFSEEMEKYINSEEEKELRIKKETLAKSFETFELKEDLKNLNKLIINEYTKNIFHKYNDKWLMSFNLETYEMLSYYTARLMYALNYYALETNSYFNENKILYRGYKATYVTILPFERLKGKIALFTAFTSASEEESVAQSFSSRKKIKELYEYKKYFSVILKIKNYVGKNCVSCGINIQDVSEFDEKEILFQPFSFFFVEDVKFDYENYTVDIDMEMISKKEKLEEKIRKGRKIIYDKDLNLLVIEGEEI